MSFIIKNLDNSRPNLQLGEFLDSELVTTINMCKNIWDQKVFPGSTYARFVISKYRGEMYYVRIEFTTEDKMLFDGYNRPGTPVYESAVFMRTLYNTVMEELHRLAAPNLFFLFDNIATAALVDNFEANLRLSTTYSGTGMLPYDASLTNRSGGGTYMAPYMPQQSGGLFTTQRDEMLRFGTEFCVGFKYFGDAERTIESVKNNSTYISVIVGFHIEIKPVLVASHNGISGKSTGSLLLSNVPLPESSGGYSFLSSPPPGYVFSSSGRSFL